MSAIRVEMDTSNFNPPKKATRDSHWAEAYTQPDVQKDVTVHVSVVIPVYGCKHCLEELHRQLVLHLEPLTRHFEIILVDDRSPDGSWPFICRIAKEDSRVKGILLSRNFGQHYAITAGLDCSRGEWVVVMDCDLQDQPKEIAKLYGKAMEGFDIVLASRAKRHDSFYKRSCSKVFHKVFDYFTDGKTDASIANFGIYSRSVIDNFKKMRERSRAFPLFINWLGFDSTAVVVEHGDRYAGESSYSFSRMLTLAASSIISQSNKPLKLSIKFGLLMSFVSFLFGLYFIGKKIFLGIPVPGWTSVIVSIFFIGGLLFANLGIIGIYIGNIFDETKGRPLYIVKETTDQINQSI